VLYQIIIISGVTYRLARNALWRSHNTTQSTTTDAACVCISYIPVDTEPDYIGPRNSLKQLL